MLTQIAALFKNAELFTKIGELFVKFWNNIKEVGFVKSFCIIIVTVGVMISVYELFVLPKTVKEVVNEVTTERENEEIAEHELLNKLRDEHKQDVDLLLKDILSDLDCDRVFVFEMHNGTNNTSGLPFKFAQMTYEDASKGTRYVCETYTNLNMSNYNLPIYLIRNIFWCGTREELAEIDPKLAQRVEDDDDIYLAFITINGVKGELGMLGIAYTEADEIKSESRIRTSLTRASQKLPSYIDKNILLNKY